jgi:hypothetical protein
MVVLEGTKRRKFRYGLGRASDVVYIRIDVVCFSFSFLFLGIEI